MYQQSFTITNAFSAFAVSGVNARNFPNDMVIAAHFVLLDQNHNILKLYWDIRTSKTVQQLLL
ncbi:MAG: hypothetical protein R3F25_09230 [Gammaproteobacteria bacterium]